MAQVLFYTKPGCSGGARQKALLTNAGHIVDERSILAEEWTPESLRPYLSNLEVSQWFNPNAPDVKSGKIVPGALSEAESLELLSSNPLLIKRPLLEIGDQLMAGFDREAIHELIGLGDVPEGYSTDCNHSDPQVSSCSTPTPQS